MLLRHNHVRAEYERLYGDNDGLTALKRAFPSLLLIFWSNGIPTKNTLFPYQFYQEAGLHIIGVISFGA